MYICVSKCVEYITRIFESRVCGFVTCIYKIIFAVEKTVVELCYGPS